MRPQSSQAASSTLFFHYLISSFAQYIQCHQNTVLAWTLFTQSQNHIAVAATIWSISKANESPAQKYSLTQPDTNQIQRLVFTLWEIRLTGLLNQNVKHDNKVRREGCPFLEHFAALTPCPQTLSCPFVRSSSSKPPPTALLPTYLPTAGSMAPAQALPTWGSWSSEEICSLGQLESGVRAHGGLLIAPREPCNPTCVFSKWSNVESWGMLWGEGAAWS